MAWRDWWLFKKRGGGKAKKKPAGRGRSSRASSGRGMPWPRWRTVWAVSQWAIGLAAIVALAWGWRVAESELLADARQAAPVLQPDMVELENQPATYQAWLVGDLKRLVIDAATPHPPRSRARLAAVHEAMSNTGWAASVRRVRLREGGGLIVEATWREAAAAVETYDGYRLVDVQGVRLPGLYERVDGLAEQGVPVIVGVASPAPEIGEVWPEREGDLSAGLALVGLVQPQPFASEVSAYDVSGRDDAGRVQLILRTTTGGLVHWGLAPGREQSIDVDAATKLERLASLVRSEGSIDAGGRRVEVFGPATAVFDRPGSSAESAD